MEKELSELTHANSKAVVMEVLGNAVGWFFSTGDAARKFGHRTSTITERIKKGLVVEGVGFRYPKKGETTESFPCLSPERKWKEKPKKQPRERKKPVFVSDDVELNHDKYAIVSYEVINLRVCVTKCTVMEHPQPFVGSAKCARCTYFKGRNKMTHEVACANKLRKV